MIWAVPRLAVCEVRRVPVHKPLGRQWKIPPILSITEAVP